MDGTVETVSGIAVGAADRGAAEALAEAVRAAAALLLPFGLEPQDFAAALERLAEPAPAEPGPAEAALP